MKSVFKDLYIELALLLNKLFDIRKNPGIGLWNTLQFWLTYLSTLHLCLVRLWKQRRAIYPKLKILEEEQFQIFLRSLQCFYRSVDLVVSLCENDKRFNHSDWKTIPFFYALHQSYLSFYSFISSLLKEINLPEPILSQARFLKNFFLTLFSPSNFPLFNPEILRTTLNQKGFNILKGTYHIILDLNIWRGYTNFQKCSKKESKLGKSVAITPGKVVFQNSLFQLIQYKAKSSKVFLNPIVIFPSWINKYYIFDLNPKTSVINWLLEEGYQVFVISWVNPNDSLKDMTVTDYIEDGILKALFLIQQLLPSSAINVVGHCLGGTLLMCALAYANQTSHSINIKSITLLSTLLDFSKAGDIKSMMGEGQIAFYKVLAKKNTLWDGRMLSAAFNFLNPNDYIWPYWIKRYGKGQSTPALDVLFWTGDMVHCTHDLYRFYSQSLYLENALVKGNLYINGIALKLNKLNYPIYAVAFKDDHISPAIECFNGLAQCLGSKRYILSEGGHFTGIIKPHNGQKTSYSVLHTFSQFTPNSTTETGSWWNDWSQWLKNNRDEEVLPIPIPFENENAPGTYALTSIFSE